MTKYIAMTAAAAFILGAATNHMMSASASQNVTAKIETISPEQFTQNARELPDTTVRNAV